MQRNKLFNNLLATFLLILVSSTMVSCQGMIEAVFGSEDYPVTQKPTKEEEKPEDNSTDKLSGNITLPTSDATTFLMNCKVINISEEAALDGTTFEIDTPSDSLVHTFMVTDENENVYLLARTMKESGSELTLNVESSALALATLHPLFGPLYGSDFTTITNKIKWSAKYSAFYKEVEEAIKQHRNLFDGSNESLIAALDALYDDVLADVDLDIFNNFVPVATTRSKTRAPYSSPNIPSAFIYADITGNVLTLQCTGLTPSYYGTVKIASTGEIKSYTVTSRSDYGGMDIFKAYDQFDLGEKCPFTFTEEGEYYFNLSRTNLEATADFYMRLANTILGIIGLDFGDQTVIREIATTIANALKDAGLTAFGPDQASFRDWFGIAYGATLDYLRRDTSIIAQRGLFNGLRAYAMILGAAWNVYGRIKGIVNATARIAYLAAAPEEINFYLCYFNGTVDTCSGVQLTIINGNGQEGKPETKLEEPLIVQVKPLGGSKLSSSYSVKYEIVSGGGTLDTELVSINSDNRAENYWTLGESGDQQVKVVVIDAITNKEISESVYFTATIEDNNFYDYCPDSNHPHWIDLGLPSGTQWRCCNEGGSTPEAYGGYYTFGQVSSAPTWEQTNELIHCCNYEWTTQNGVTGGKFTGPNGGTIFLPAAGYLWFGEFYHVGSYGDYWSSTPSDEGYIGGLGFSSDIAGSLYSSSPDEGQSVRPVR